MIVPISPWGQMYVKLIEEGVICGCELYLGSTCDKCLEKKNTEHPKDQS